MVLGSCVTSMQCNVCLGSTSGAGGGGGEWQTGLQWLKERSAGVQCAACGRHCRCWQLQQMLVAVQLDPMHDRFLLPPVHAWDAHAVCWGNL